MDKRVKLTEIASNIFNIRKEEIDFGAKKESIESWDSFAHLALLSTVEEEMGVVIPFEEVEAIDSLDKLFEKIKGQ